MSNDKLKAAKIILEEFIKNKGNRDNTKGIKGFNFKEIEIKSMSFKEAKGYVIDNHYSHSMPNGTKISLGFFYKGDLVTIIIYGNPPGRRTISMLGVERESCVELTRLFSSDGLPKNTESYCIAQSFKFLKENYPEIKYLISYSDPNHGHLGYIYQATNWRYIGFQRIDNKPTEFTHHERIFLDGKETHKRNFYNRHGTCEVGKLKEIYGDRFKQIPTLKKHVYIMCLGNKKEKREWYKKFPSQEYPKLEKLVNRL